MARLRFQQNRFDEARDFLEAEQYNEIYFKIGAKRLLIMICLEQDERELLNSLVQNFYMFIYRDDIVSDSAVLSNRDFINIVKSMLRIAPRDSENWDKLLAKTKAKKRLPERIWLQQKICEKSKNRSKAGSNS